MLEGRGRGENKETKKIRIEEKRGEKKGGSG